ncbi:amidohydrolase family protein, partial [Streptomyces sp. NPDC059506]|uniref:amidohydrolase family protein n=1 Tax=Streptomyces sp. NPDC059506 TaxID=3347751 RepID=UPI00367EE8D3
APPVSGAVSPPRAPGRPRARPGGGARDHVRTGAAIHSVRAVPAGQLAVVADWAADRDAPLHVHLSEQTAENDACLAAHGVTPTRLLADRGALGPRTTAVHATHLTDDDVRLLGASGTGVCMCPTTERDLADGIGPAPRLSAAGCPLSLGSDSHAVVDPFEEARAMEMDERLRTRTRGHWTAARLLRAATEDGHAALGRPDAGRIAPGAPADLTTVALDTVRTAGPAPPRGAPTAGGAAPPPPDCRLLPAARRAGCGRQPCAGRREDSRSSAKSSPSCCAVRGPPRRYQVPRWCTEPK